MRVVQKRLKNKNKKEDNVYPELLRGDFKPKP